MGVSIKSAPLERGNNSSPWWFDVWGLCFDLQRWDFHTIPTWKSYGTGVFVPARTHREVKLLRTELKSAGTE